MMKWKRQGADNFFFEDEGVTAHLTLEWVSTIEKDRNIPKDYEHADPELLADGIPALVRQYEDLYKEWQQWKRQGWRPKNVNRQEYHLLIKHKDSNQKFHGVIDTDNPRVALKKAEEAIWKIHNRKYPRWMKKAQNAGMARRVASIYLAGKG